MTCQVLGPGRVQKDIGLTERVSTEMSPAPRAESLDQGFSEPPSSSLDGLLES